jgi:uncharacterized protein
MSVMSEEALMFAGPQGPLVGVLSRPALPGDVGVVVIVGGPQYRVGSHRQFVLLARFLAAQGFHVLRFDYRGMGDSAGDLHNFEQVSDDIHAAIHALQSSAPGVQRVVLWGLCDGASAALLYLQDRPDKRVAGLVLLNPWVRSEASLAKTHVKHYYTQRLKSREFWRKLLTGQVATSALSGLWDSLRLAFGGAGPPARVGHDQAPYQGRMAQAWLAFDGAILLLLSEQDLTAQEFVEFSAADGQFQKAFKRCAPRRVVLADADHTCSSPAAQRAAEQATADWLRAEFVKS